MRRRAILGWAFVIICFLVPVSGIYNLKIEWGFFMYPLLLILIVCCLFAKLIYLRGAVLAQKWCQNDLLLSLFILAKVALARDFRQEELLTLTISYFWYLVIRNSSNKNDDLRYILISLKLILLYGIAFFAFQFWINPSNAVLDLNTSGPFGHPGYSVGVLALGFSIYYHFHIKNNEASNFSKFEASLFFTAILLLAIYHVARAPLIVLVIIVISLLKDEVIKSKGINRALIVLSTIGLIITGYLKFDSIRGRIFIWKGVLNDLDVNSLMFGKGMGAFTKNYTEYQISYFRSSSFSEKEYELADFVILAYNDFLQILYEGGLVCLLIIILFSIRLLIVGKGNRMLFIGFFLYMQFWTILNQLPFAILFFVFSAYTINKANERIQI